MTVAELREILLGHDPDMRVVVMGYEGGYDDPGVYFGHAEFDTNWKDGALVHGWDGRHCKCDLDGHVEVEFHPRAVKVVVVGRG